MAGPAARRCVSPPRRWTSRCCAASWRGPYGRRRRCAATARGPTPRAPIAGRCMRTRPTSCGTPQIGSRPGRHGAPGCGTRRRPSPSWGRPTSGQPTCGGRASSPSDWRGGWSERFWTSTCTACTACTWRSSPPAWPRTATIRRTIGIACSRTSRNRGPTTPSPGTILSAPFRGMWSATSRAFGQGPRRAGDGLGTFSGTCSDGHWALACRPVPVQVSWADLALDYEAFVGRALPASPNHHLRGPPLRERAQVLCKAAGLVERHLVVGTLLCGAPMGPCRSMPLS